MHLIISLILLLILILIGTRVLDRLNLHTKKYNLFQAISYLIVGIIMWIMEGYLYSLFSINVIKVIIFFISRLLISVGLIILLEMYIPKHTSKS